MSSPRAIRIPPPRTPISRDRSTLLRRVGRWRKSALWMWRKLNALPKTARIVVIAATILAVFSATNLVYHLVRKPTEVFAPVSGEFNKTLLKLGANMHRSFASIPPQPFHPSYSRRR